MEKRNRIKTVDEMEFDYDKGDGNPTHRVITPTSHNTTADGREMIKGIDKDADDWRQFDKSKMSKIETHKRSRD